MRAFSIAVANRDKYREVGSREVISPLGIDSGRITG
jgi:hypothetical protein